MKNFLVLIFMISAALLSAHAQTAAKRSDEEALRYLKEVEWPKAYREQDTALLDRILADEFQRIGSGGEYSTKKDEMRYIANNKPTYLSFKFVIKRLEIFENGTAVVAGTGTVKNRDRDGEHEMVYQSTNVLIKRNGLWKAIASHTSGNTTTRIK